MLSSKIKDIVITVSGPAGSGKSAIMTEILGMLMVHGFGNISTDFNDDRIGEDLEFEENDERIAALIRNQRNINIRIVEKIAEQE